MDDKFVSETIKERPINKRRLFRRTFFIALAAVIFGVIACTTFLLLEPVVSDMLYPQEIKQVEISNQNEEVNPSELLTEKEAEYEMTEAAKEAATEAAISAIEDAKANGDGLSIGDVASYESLYGQMYDIAQQALVSVVQVTGVKVETDWFQNTVENENHVAGLIIADNGQQLLILADAASMPDVEKISVTFYDGSVASAALLSQDNQTGLGIYTVLRGDLSLDTRAELTYANLGSSVSTDIVGKPVIAIGSPRGDYGSLCYGMITSVGTTLKLADATYRVLGSDIYGTMPSSGFFINTKGEVIGVITKNCLKNTKESLLSTIGISALKPLIEKLSNNEELCYAGIYGMDVTTTAHIELGVPYGGYVTYIEPESPAMVMGVTKGDVITKLNDTQIMTFRDYQEAMLKLAPGDELHVTLYRYSAGQYVEFSIDGTVQKMQEKKER